MPHRLPCRGRVDGRAEASVSSSSAEHVCIHGPLEFSQNPLLPSIPDTTPWQSVNSSRQFAPHALHHTSNSNHPPDRSIYSPIRCYHGFWSYVSLSCARSLMSMTIQPVAAPSLFPMRSFFPSNVYHMVVVVVGKVIYLFCAFLHLWSLTYARVCGMGWRADCFAFVCPTHPFLRNPFCLGATPSVVAFKHSSSSVFYSMCVFDR